MNKKVVIGIIVAVLVAVIAFGEYLYYTASNSTMTEEEAEEYLSSKQENEAIVSNENTTETEEVIPEDTLGNSKILIAYFSRADENYKVGTVEVGNTEIMAGFIKEYLGDKADTFKIDTVKAYPAEYKECTDVAKQEQNEDARPEFKGDIDISEYDTIFLGYPIWWGDVPMVINTFLEKYDFSGKTIIPFCTHEGSGNAGTFTSLKNKMKDSVVNTDGLAIRGETARKEESRSTVENWLEGLGF